MVSCIASIAVLMNSDPSVSHLVYADSSLNYFKNPPAGVIPTLLDDAGNINECRAVKFNIDY